MSIPVYLLSGFLGAGKTSALNNLLKQPFIANKNIALIINEFGKVGVDGALVGEGDYTKYEINKGSLFCICTKTDFLKVLDDLRVAVKPELIIIEATGIAQTADIEGFVKEQNFGDVFHISANICLVDAENFTKLAPFLKSAIEQVRWADGLVINKSDLVDEPQIEKLTSMLKQINPTARLTTTTYGQIQQGWIETLEHVERDGLMASTPPKDVIAVSFDEDMKVDRQKFFELLNSLGTDLLRLKGNVDFADGGEFVEVIWGKVTEKDLLKSMGSNTKFTAIGFNISTDKIREYFTQTFICS